MAVGDPSDKEFGDCEGCAVSLDSSSPQGATSAAQAVRILCFAPASDAPQEQMRARGKETGKRPLMG